MSETDSQLKNLLDYTIFHIGVYISLFSGLVAFLSFRKPTGTPYCLIMASIVLFLLAGAAGGIIGSNIPNSSKWSDYSVKKLGPWGFKWLTYEYWAHIEHAAFWLAAFLGAIGLITS
jgi:hypothetical protein